MTTTSGNIAGVVRPIGGPLRRPVSGSVYDVSDFMPKKKKKKKKKGVYELVSLGNGVLIEEKREKKYKVDGKLGVWRTIRGRHYFFPDDNSGPIPPFHVEQ